MCKCKRDEVESEREGDEEQESEAPIKFKRYIHIYSSKKIHYIYYCLKSFL